MTKTNISIGTMTATISEAQINEYFDTTSAPDYRSMIAEHGLDALPPFELQEMLEWYEAQLAAELENLENQKFTLAMKDHWRSEDRIVDLRMGKRIADIKQQLNPQPVIIPPSAEEKATLGELMNWLLENPKEDPLFKLYSRLASRYNGRAPYDPGLLEMRYPKVG